MKRIITICVLVFGILNTSSLIASHIVGGDISYECLGNNQFKITAINDAYPSNTGEGTHTFKVDKEGPSILLANPSLTDKVSNGSHVMGRNFNINIFSFF